MTITPDDQEAKDQDIEVKIDVEEFVATILTFPCFEDAKLDKEPAELFEIIMNAYRQDNLTEEQDLVVELLLHMSEPSSSFNLKRASEVWTEEDLNAFWDVICPSYEEFEEEGFDHNQ
ncbi:hypothetical protein [Pseudobacteriovorax antillogorgiicola]|uniref:Uncharacterized protein n=1 Tax=Pseudobacteriovorax antillogorgiicola TaxID=1513793 RepID=A0A1Y6BSH0_9BACT|nr:hypothetical protein [Pseudobacteriovorax antillogorgiicola]TCS53105.1 hypothetical protein EDD56_108156 [Pseudobacteriovorax antillogorgiicola]SMF25692.1 hypothetical protein SAMN06296036_10890 [Pseudobacteriovorax antillogorgiicola]